MSLITLAVVLLLTLTAVSFRTGLFLAKYRNWGKALYLIEIVLSTVLATCATTLISESAPALKVVVAFTVGVLVLFRALSTSMSVDDAYLAPEDKAYGWILSWREARWYVGPSTPYCNALVCALKGEQFKRGFKIVKRTVSVGRARLRYEYILRICARPDTDHQGFMSVVKKLDSQYFHWLMSFKVRTRSESLEYMRELSTEHNVSVELIKFDILPRLRLVG